MNGATFSTGKLGQAFDLNGTTQYVALGDLAQFEMDRTMTIEAWVRPDDVSNYRQIVSKMGSVGQYAYQLYLRPTAA